MRVTTSAVRRFSGLICSCLALTIAAGAHPARADSTYQPYYMNRDDLQYATTSAPIKSGQPVAPAPQPGVPTDWQKPAVTLGEEQPGSSGPRLHALEIGTRDGIDVGIQASNYHYQEHIDADSQSLRENGIKAGGHIDATATFPYGIFLTGDARVVYSKDSYSSDATGTLNDKVPDFVGDGRLLVGKDVLLGGDRSTTAGYDISPYVGLGFRDLYTDLHEIPGIGYRRNSEYFYVPAGITQRFRFFDEARISVNAEYDRVLLGRQTSYYSDADPAQPDTSNEQDNGYGIRGSIMYERDWWSIGPFVEYWNINQSDINDLGFAPHNQTLDYGGQLSVHFW